MKFRLSGDIDVGRGKGNMKKKKYNKRLIYVSIALAISLILNIILCIILIVKTGNSSGGSKVVQSVSDEKYAIDKSFVGIWECKGNYFAFTENGEVYNMIISSNLRYYDLIPSRDYIEFCRKGHMDENNNIVYTEVFNILDALTHPEDPVMYIFNVSDLEYKVENTVGEKVYKESSEVLVIGSEKYLRTSKYDYVLTNEYPPENACSWDYQDYYLHIIDDEGSIISKITYCTDTSGIYAEDKFHYLEIDDTAAKDLDNCPEKHIKIDFSGTILCEGQLSELWGYFDGLNSRLKVDISLLPERYEMIFEGHLK